MRARLWTLALLALPASADTWIRVSSPSTEIFTDSSVGTARAVLSRFETLHRVFSASRFDSSPARVRVFIFASRRDFLEYEITQNAAGFYRPGDDRDLIVAYEDTALKSVSSHEYLHMVMRHSSATLPLWLDEGMAEFYSTIAVGKTKMRVGDTIPSHLRQLANQKWLTAEDLTLGNRADGPIFYAESWALVHMLSLAPQWKDGMPVFVRLLNEGREQDDAFTEAFGKRMDDALTALRPYLRNPKDLTTAAPPIEEAETYQVTRLTPLDIELAWADLALRTGRIKLARTKFLHAAKNNPQSPAAVAALGSLALAENRKDAARDELERAVAMGLQDADAYFELAMLKNDSTLLERALTVDPHFAAVHFLLGSRATDAADFTTAIDHLREAVALQPRRFTYWHALGYAQAKSGDRQGASESARRAAILAADDQERQMAASLTLFASEVPGGRVRKPDVITPPSWQNRKGDTRVEGTLVRVACDASPVRLSLSTNTPARTIELNVQNPAQVELLNAEGASTTLVCGEQSRPVVVEYIAATLEITRIEFQHVIMKR
jgi:tetratricopeptide (TPR) repeat protein